MKVQRLFVLLLILMLTILQHPKFSEAQATTYYVSTSGSDSNPGTQSQPWHTIQHAAGTLTAGDTALIRGGTYNEQGITFTNSGSSGSSITIKAYPSETPIIDLGYTASSNPDDNIPRPVFNIDKNFITLDGLTIKNTYVVGILVGYNAASTDIILQNLTMRDLVPIADSSADIYITHVDNLLIQNSIFTGIQGSEQHDGAAVLIFVSDHITIQNNEMGNMNNGIYYAHSNDDSYVSTIQNNLIYGMNNWGILWSRSYGIIKNNVIRDSTTGIRLFEEDADCDSLVTAHNQLLHNTIVASGAALVLDRSNSCTGAVYTTVKDNLIYGFTDSDHVGTSIWHYFSTDSSNTIYDHNLIYDSSYSSPITIAENFYTASTLPGTISGSNNIQSAPTFVDYANRSTAVTNLKLTSTSAGHNAASDGTDVGAPNCAVGVNATCSADGYISTSGSDSNLGTQAQPWATIQKAASTLTAGQTALIRGGTYNEQGITFAHSGSSGNPITIKAYPGETPIIDLGYTAASNPGDKIPRLVFDIDKDFITLDGLTIQNTYVVAIRAGYNAASTNITFQNMSMKDLVPVNDNSADIYVTHVDNLLIQNSLFTGIQGSERHDGAAVQIFTSNTITIQNNEMGNMNNGIYYKHSNDDTYVSTIQNNLIYGMNNWGILWSRSYGIIKNNVIRDSTTGVRFFEESADCDHLATSNNQLLHNTIVASGASLVLDRSNSCTGAIDTTVKDNLIYGFTDSDHLGTSIWHYRSTDGSNTTYDHNLIYDPSYSSPISIAGNTYTASTLPGTVSGSGNIQSAPTFVDYADRNATVTNLALTSSSSGHNAASDGADMGAPTCAVGINAVCP